MRLMLIECFAEDLASLADHAWFRVKRTVGHVRRESLVVGK
jgi:hypothetical protein